MMTNRTKKKVYQWALFVALGLLMLPALFLTGCTKSPSNRSAEVPEDMVHAAYDPSTEECVWVLGRSPWDGKSPSLIVGWPRCDDPDFLQKLQEQR